MTSATGRSERASALLDRFAPAFAVGMGARIIGQAISFVLVVVASRFLGLEEFGVYALAWAATVIATTFVFTGYYHAILRAPDLEEAADTLFWLMALVGLIGSTVIFLAGFAVGGVVGATLTAASGVPLLAVPISWWEAQLVRAGRIRASSLYNVAAEGAALAAAILWLNDGMGIAALIGARYVSVLVGLGLTGTLVRRLPRLRFSRAIARQARPTVLPLWGTTAIGMSSNYGADFVLAAFLSPAAVGAYRSGARIAVTAADIVYQPLRTISWSRFARLANAGDRSGLSTAWGENIGMAAAMLWPAMAGIALLAEPLVVTIFDESWRAAAPVVAILCLSRALAVPLALMDPILSCLDKGGLLFRLRLTSGGLLLAGLLVLGPFGPSSAALAVAGTMGTMSLVTLGALAGPLGLTVSGLVRIFLPGLLLTVLAWATLMLVSPMLDTLPVAQAIAIRVVAVALTWLVGAGLLLKLKLLVLPRP